jgi:hypothetical protein
MQSVTYQGKESKDMLYDEHNNDKGTKVTEDYQMALREADDAIMEKLEAAGWLYDRYDYSVRGFGGFKEVLDLLSDLGERRRRAAQESRVPVFKRVVQKILLTLSGATLAIAESLENLGSRMGTVPYCAICKEVALITCDTCWEHFCDTCWESHSTGRAVSGS